MGRDRMEKSSVEQKTATNGGPDRPARNVGSRKRARAFPKGRQLDVEALREVRELLGSRPRRPDLLIEFLHLIQDRYHYLSARHLRALCDEMRLPQAAVYEVATFYSHFDVVKEGEAPPPPTDHPRLQFDHLRAQGRGGAARLAQGRDEPFGGARPRAPPAWAAATPRRCARLGISTSITPRVNP